VTPRPGHDVARSSRRGFLTGGLALGASLTLPGCAYIRDDAPTDVPAPPSAMAKIDGDLVYFNWADYLAPSVVKGFQEECVVKVIVSNSDSMEGMYANMAAGNEYDIVFPGAMWDVKLKREGKLRYVVSIASDLTLNVLEQNLPRMRAENRWNPGDRVQMGWLPEHTVVLT